MKTLLSILATFTFGFVSAQVDPQVQPEKPNTQKDTTTTNSQIQKESDLKTMDAVKTDDHPKTTKKPEGTTKKDTIPKKSTRRK